MDQQTKELLEIMAAVAANAGFALISVKLGEAVKSGQATRQHITDALLVAQEECRNDLVDRITTLIASNTEWAQDPILGRELPANWHPGIMVGSPRRTTSPVGWYTDFANRAGTAHFYSGVMRDGAAYPACGVYNNPCDLLPEAESLRRCARCTKITEGTPK